MSASLVNVRSKKVPTLYEADESKYVGPHRWQIQGWARVARRIMRHHAYTRWVQHACSEIQIDGLEHLKNINGPAIFIANHQSHLDTLVVHSAMPEHVRCKLYFGAAQDRWFVRGKKKLTLKPWYQSLVLGNFPILRGGGTRALSYAKWLVDRDQHIFLFPEGTRAQAGELGDFKLGAAIIAQSRNIPIVPIHLSGLEKIRPKGQQKAIRGAAKVDILAPVQIDANEDIAEATTRIRSQLAELHTKYNKPESVQTKTKNIAEAA